MFAEETLLSIIFRLFNFGLIIALAAYCFKIYILPGIYAAIAKEEAEKQHLGYEKIKSEQEQAALDECIKEDRVTCELFKSKIDHWKNVVDSTRVAYEKKCLERDGELRRKRVQRIELQKKYSLQAHVAQSAATQLEQSLSAYFEKNRNAAEQYIEHIVTFMGKRVQ